VGVLVGSFGLFFTCFLLFIRVLPMIAMWEIKGVVGQPGPAVLPAAEAPARDKEVAGA
jgi:molybdopterin-containing oxidoreductase family membrane subunit